MFDKYFILKCEQSCDEAVGVKRRDIMCVWKGTNDTAGEGACRKRNHPEAVTTCHRPTFDLECRDKENLRNTKNKTIIESTPQMQTKQSNNKTQSLNKGKLILVQL